MFSINACPAKTTGSRRASMVISGCLTPRVLSITAAILSFALLAPFFGGLTPYLQAERSSCGMSCCAGKKYCCCRSSPAETKYPRIRNAAARCLEDCAHRPLLPRSPGIALIAARILSCSVGETDILDALSHPFENRRDLAFALFGRPPPFC